MPLCKNCNHEIKKVTFTSNGQVMWEYRHKMGGRYCKRTVYGKGLPFGKVCYCTDAAPQNEQKVEKEENP